MGMADRDEDGRYEAGHNLPGPGRPSLYDEAMNDQATKLALLGMTDSEMAKFFGVAQSTFYEWMNLYPAFSEAVYAGKTAADAEVAYSLYRRATGVVYEVEKLRKNKEGETEVVKLKVSEPPETGAAKLWLTNRRRQNWSEKISIGGDPNNPLSVVTRVELVALEPNDDSTG